MAPLAIVALRGAAAVAPSPSRGEVRPLPRKDLLTRRPIP